MAHVKQAAAKAHQKANVVGKRRGLKVGSGQIVNAGTILVRQLGTKYHPGRNTRLARNYDIIARVTGKVVFSKRKRDNGTYKTVINIDPINA